MNNKYKSQSLNSKLLKTIRNSKVYKSMDDKLNITKKFWWILGGILGFIVIVIIASNVISYISDRPVAEEYTAEGVYIDPDGKHNVEYIKKRAKQIYISINPNKRKKYSTKGFYELCEKAQELDTMEPDDDPINIKKVDFVFPRCHKFAYAVFENYHTTRTYWLRFERGDWYVDDIMYSAYAEKAHCCNIIAEHGQLKFLSDWFNLNGTWSNGDGNSFSISGFKIADEAECNIKNLKISGLQAFENKSLKGKIYINTFGGQYTPTISVREDNLDMEFIVFGGVIQINYKYADIDEAGIYFKQ